MLNNFRHFAGVGHNAFNEKELESSISAAVLLDLLLSLALFSLGVRVKKNLTVLTNC